jgi:HicB family
MEAAGAPQESGQTRSTRRRTGSHSGRLLLRMPEELHADLARAADRAGVSLNAYITDTLAQTVGKPREQSSAPKPRRGNRRLVERLLVVNVIVLAAVGGLAIALLVQALR